MSLTVKPVSSLNALPSSGHYSQAVRANGFLFISGQLGTVEGQSSDRPVEEQTCQVLNSLQTIILDAGGELDDVVKVTIYLADITYWNVVDQCYTRAFGHHKPARAIVPAPGLHFGSALELEAVALDRAVS